MTNPRRLAKHHFYLKEFFNVKYQIYHWYLICRTLRCLHKFFSHAKNEEKIKIHLLSPQSLVSNVVSWCNSCKVDVILIKYSNLYSWNVCQTYTSFICYDERLFAGILALWCVGREMGWWWYIYNLIMTN